MPIGPLHPYPYVDELATVQQSPEAADGAARPEIWTDEEFGTGGQRAHVPPPEGLHWIVAPAARNSDGPPGELLALVRAHPDAAPGVRLDAEGAREDGRLGLPSADTTPGVRLVVPWHAEGLPGEVSLDFARDERLPEAPVLTAVPRGDGGPPAVLLTSSRALSLAWKLLWLQADAAAGGRARGKDLYDAVLLAEAPGTTLSPRLLRRVTARGPGHPASASRLAEVRPALGRLGRLPRRPPRRDGHGRAVAGPSVAGAGRCCGASSMTWTTGARTTARPAARDRGP